MKRIYSIVVLLCFSLMSFAIDWSNYAWLGSGEEAYANKFKVAAAFGQTVVNKSPYRVFRTGSLRLKEQEHYCS